MSRVGGFIVFLVIALSLIGGLHYYFWARLVRDTALPAPWRQLATGALWLLGLSIPATMILWRSHHPLRNALAWPAFVWMGMLMILMLVVFGADVVRLLVHAGGGARDPERRLLLQRVLGRASSSSPAITSTTPASPSGWRTCRRSACACCATSASPSATARTRSISRASTTSARAVCRDMAPICRAPSRGATRRASWCCS